MKKKLLRVIVFKILAMTSILLSGCTKSPSIGNCYVKIHKLNGGQMGEVWHIEDIVNGVVKYQSTVQIDSPNYKSAPIGGENIQEMSLEKFQQEIKGRENIGNCVK